MDQLVTVVDRFMSEIIFLVAVIEAIIFIFVAVQCKSQSAKLDDTLSNITKGLTDYPDLKSGQSIHDRFQSIFSYLDRKIKSSEDDAKTISRNINSQLEKNTSHDTFMLESLYNIGSALVQIFPLLGILGTILALSLIPTEGGMKPTEVTSAFVKAIDTTILGMFFAIIFMIWEARSLTRVKRVLDDTQKANELFSVSR